MSADIESLVCDLCRMRSRWGARRLAFELSQRRVEPVPVQATIHRALVRNGLVEPHAQRHKREYRRWQPGDGVHPNDAGHAAIAEVFDLDVLRQ